MTTTVFLWIHFYLEKVTKHQPCSPLILASLLHHRSSILRICCLFGWHLRFICSSPETQLPNMTSSPPSPLSPSQTSFTFTCPFGAKCFFLHVTLHLYSFLRSFCFIFLYSLMYITNSLTFFCPFLSFIFTCCQLFPVYFTSMSSGLTLYLRFPPFSSSFFFFFLILLWCLKLRVFSDAVS